MLSMFVAIALVCSFISAWPPTLILADWVNITIDDTLGDAVTGAQFTYSPPDAWSPGQNCTGCVAHPDAGLAYDHTWHDTSFFPAERDVPMTASASFNGSALYVYCIIFHTTSDPDGYTDLTFLIDGDTVGSFTSIPTNSSTIYYNYPVYVNESIPWGTHMFTLVNGRRNGLTSLALFDYVQYTTKADLIGPGVEAPTMKPSSSNAITSTVMDTSATVTETEWKTSSDTLNAQTRTIIIATTTVGGTLFLALCALLYFCRRHRYKTYRVAPESFFCKPKSARVDANRQASGWAEDAWINANLGRPSHRSIPSVKEALLNLAAGRVGAHAHQETVISFASSQHDEQKMDEYLPVILETPSVYRQAAPRQVREEPVEDESHITSGSARSTQHTPTPQLILTIPPRSVSPLPELESFPSPPPSPPSTTIAMRPKSETVRPSSHHTKASRHDSEPMPPTPPTMAGAGARGSVVLGSDRTIVTVASTLTTPTSVVPSGYFLSYPNTPHPPARADSLSTVNPMPLVPNRRPDMDGMGTTVAAEGAQGSSRERSRGSERTRFGFKWKGNRPSSSRTANDGSSIGSRG